MDGTEVIKQFTAASKPDGLGYIQGSEKLVAIIEFTSGISFISKTKYSSDIKNMYENVMKTIGHPGTDIIFIALYFSKIRKFESQYVRYNYTISECPSNSSELQEFVKDIKNFFSWVLNLVEFAKTIN